MSTQIKEEFAKFEFTQDEVAVLPFELPTEDDIMDDLKELGIRNVEEVYGGQGIPGCSCSSAGSTVPSCCWS